MLTLYAQNSLNCEHLFGIHMQYARVLEMKLTNLLSQFQSVACQPRKSSEILDYRCRHHGDHKSEFRLT